MRKAQAKKLPLSPDAKYNDKLVTRFVNNIMWQGKKSGAFNIFYDAIDKVSKQTNEMVTRSGAGLLRMLHLQ
jgi:small subunit ribosomal protein S7